MFNFKFRFKFWTTIEIQYVFIWMLCFWIFPRMNRCHFILKLIFLKVFLVHVFSAPKGNERWEGKNGTKHCFNGKKQRNYFCVMSILTFFWYFVCLSDYCKFWFYIRSRPFVQLQQWMDGGRFLIFDVVLHLNLL